MQNPRLMGGVEAGDHLKDGVDGFGRTHRAGCTSNPVFQRAPGQQFHRDHRHAVNLLGPEDVDAVRVMHGGGKLAFSQEPAAVHRSL